MTLGPIHILSQQQHTFNLVPDAEQISSFPYKMFTLPSWRPLWRSG